jgi:hypothetical protein
MARLVREAKKFTPSGESKSVGALLVTSRWVFVLPMMAGGPKDWAVMLSSVGMPTAPVEGLGLNSRFVGALEVTLTTTAGNAPEVSLM